MGKESGEPKAMRAYLINLGDEDAQNVKVRLRNPANQGGNVFAEGVVPLIPKRSDTIGESARYGPMARVGGAMDLGSGSPRLRRPYLQALIPQLNHLNGFTTWRIFLTHHCAAWAAKET